MKLDIINIDNLKKVKQSKYRNRHPLLPQHPFNMLIVGQTNTGKTSFLLNLILRRFIEYDKIYYYGKHLHQPKIQMLVKAFDEIYDKTEDDILEVSNDIRECITPDDIDPEEGQTLMIWDDMIGEKDLSVVEDWYIRGRHSNASCIFISQVYMKVLRPIRLNTHYFVFYGTPNRRELNIIYQENGYNLDKEEFIKRFNQATKVKYNFFLIDNKTTTPELQYRKNFNYIYKLKNNEQEEPQNSS